VHLCSDGTDLVVIGALFKQDHLNVLQSQKTDCPDDMAIFENP